MALHESRQKRTAVPPSCGTGCTCHWAHVSLPIPLSPLLPTAGCLHICMVPRDTLYAVGRCLRPNKHRSPLSIYFGPPSRSLTSVLESINMTHKVCLGRKGTWDDPARSRVPTGARTPYTQAHHTYCLSTSALRTISQRAAYVGRHARDLGIWLSDERYERARVLWGECDC
ncbi:hypothetical protein LY78DRAFT_174787 [Colletotrichum sublineola]|nr:hypothetical protein LY78DRAFT_174787 [Colletotrichum sublineola]